MFSGHMHLPMPKMLPSEPAMLRSAAAAPTEDREAITSDSEETPAPAMLRSVAPVETGESSSLDKSSPRPAQDQPAPSLTQRKLPPSFLLPCGMNIVGEVTVVTDLQTMALKSFVAPIFTSYQGSNSLFAK